MTGLATPSSEYAGLVSPLPGWGLRKLPLREKMLCLRSCEGDPLSLLPPKPQWKKDEERDLIEPGVSTGLPGLLLLLAMWLRLEEGVAIEG